MSFVSFILILSTIAILVQVYILFVSENDLIDFRLSL